MARQDPRWGLLEALTESTHKREEERREEEDRLGPTDEDYGA